MSAFRDYVENLALQLWVKEFNRSQPLLNQAQSDGTGQAQVTKMNTDGTIDVTLNGQTYSKVSPGTRPTGVGMTVQLVDGKQIIR